VNTYLYQDVTGVAFIVWYLYVKCCS